MKFIRLFSLLFVTILLQSCSSNNESSEDLNEVITELVYFTFTPQINSIPERLQYQIKFTNPNNVNVKGFYRITTKATFGSEVIESSKLSTNFSVCYEIEANSSCTFTFDETGDINIGSTDLIEFVSASYRIDDTF